jgi:hypothetical protein
VTSEAGSITSPKYCMPLRLSSKLWLFYRLTCGIYCKLSEVCGINLLAVWSDGQFCGMKARSTRWTTRSFRRCSTRLRRLPTVRAEIRRRRRRGLGGGGPGRRGGQTSAAWSVRRSSSTDPPPVSRKAGLHSVACSRGRRGRGREITPSGQAAVARERLDTRSAYRLWLLLLDTSDQQLQGVLSETPEGFAVELQLLDFPFHPFPPFRQSW